MATVNIQLSQTVIDQQHLLELNGDAIGSVGGLVDVFGSDDYGIDPNIQFLSWSLTGSTLRVNYTAGVTETYTGVVMDNPNASRGHASATGYEMRQPGVVSISATGKMNVDYVVGSDNSLSATTSAQGHTFTSMRIATEFPATSAKYDPVFGNIAIAVNGTFTVNAAGETHGTVNSLTLNTDKLLLSSTIEGSFRFDDYQPDGTSGFFTGYREIYRDGSAINIAGLNAAVSGAQNLGGGVFANAPYFDGNDDIAIDLPGHLYSRSLVSAGAGDDRISLKGGGGQLDVDAGAGRDRITILGDAHSVDGGSGIDTVLLFGARTSFTVQRAASTQGNSAFTVTDKAGVVDQLVNVERILFADAAFALDIDGNAGQAYRLYQAALNRTPDAAGLGFWINTLDQGESLVSVARGFVASKECQDNYGSLAGNRALVTQFYQNILERAPEQAGLDYWVGILDTKAASVAEVLSFISESGENKDGLAKIIGNGFTYTPYGAV